jgi:hypothetical protein
MVLVNVKRTKGKNPTKEREDPREFDDVLNGKDGSM